MDSIVYSLEEEEEKEEEEEEEEEAGFNIKSNNPNLKGGEKPFFPQHIVEGLLNSRRRVSDRPSWILTSKTPARKWKNIEGRLFFCSPTRN